MHGEAWWFLEAQTKEFAGLPIKVLEFGSRDVNGTPRNLDSLKSASLYFGVDISDGPGVEMVADAATCRIDLWDGGYFDLVICAEVFEHTPDWDQIVHNAYAHLKEGGVFLCSAASDPRPAHSAVDGHNMEPHEYTSQLDVPDREWYENISPASLSIAMHAAAFRDIYVTTHDRGDVYGRGLK